MIQASGVNKNWYNLAAESLPSEKLKLVFNHESKPDIEWEFTLSLIRDVLYVLQATKREYQHIEVRETAFNGLVDFSPIFKAARWKSVTLSQCGFRSHDALTELLDTINDSVQELTITGCSLAINYRERLGFYKLEFRSLKELDCNLSLSNYFQECKSLIKLKIPSKADDRPALRKMLLQNSNLKDLAVGVEAVVGLPEFKFKLQKLWITDETLFISNELLLDFLLAQAESLESLRIDVMVNETCNGLIRESLNSLKALTFG